MPSPVSRPTEAEVAAALSHRHQVISAVDELRALSPIAYDAYLLSSARRGEPRERLILARRVEPPSEPREPSRLAKFARLIKTALSNPKALVIAPALIAAWLVVGWRTGFDPPKAYVLLLLVVNLFQIPFLISIQASAKITEDELAAELKASSGQAEKNKETLQSILNVLGELDARIP